MKKISILIIVLCAFNCSNKRVDTKAAFEGMKSQEIQVVSDAAIIDKAMSLGDSLSSILNVSLEGEKLSWSQPDSGETQVVGLLFNQENTLTGKERSMFEAYLYNTKNNIKSSSNVQFLEDPKFVLYSKAMVYNGKEVGMWSIKIPRKTIVLSVAK